MFGKRHLGLAASVRRATGLFLAVSLGYSAAPVGFNWMFGEAADAVQRAMPRPGPYSDQRGTVQLGKFPDRDPLGRKYGWWTPKLTADLKKVVKKEREERPRKLKATPPPADLGFLWTARHPEPIGGEGGGYGGEAIATSSSSSTTTTSTGTTSTSGGSDGGGPGLTTGGGSELSSKTGNSLTRVAVTGWSSAGDSRVSFNLYHNSMEDYLFDVGAGWSHSYDVRVTTGESSAIVRWHDGTRHPYAAEFGDYVAPPGVHDELVHNGNGTWTLTTKYQSVLEFNTSGRLTAVKDKFGNQVTIARDGNQNVTTVTDEDNRQLEFTYNEDDFIETITDPLERVWEFTYNGSDQLTVVTYPDLDAESHTREFTYDGNDNILTATDREGNVWTWTYDGSDRETSITDPLDKEWTFAYTTSAVTMTDPLDNETVHNYSAGMIVSTVDAADYSDAFEWDEDKNLTEYTDRRGKVWTATYDANGNMLTVEDPLSREWTYTYNGDNYLTSVTDPLDNETVVAYYGGSQAPTSITDPLDRIVATLTYDGDGDLLTVEDALERVTEYGYDSYKNVNSVTAPDSTEVTATYNLVGWVTDVTDAALDETLVEYDEWGRITGIEHSDESTVTIAYNLEGLIVSATDELSRTGTRTYDDAYRLTATENARGDDTTIAYNAADWVTSVTNGRSYARTYTYTVRGEVYTLTLPDSSVESWSYDAEGNTSSYTNPLSQTISYSYNDAGDLTLINYPTGTDTSFTYDGAGRTDSMTDATGTSEWTFNAAGEVTLLETPQGDIEYAYNAAGQVISMEVDGTDLTEYDYDAYGRFESLTNPFSEVTSVTYDAAGRVNRKDFDSGVYETFAYDDRSRPELLLVKNSGNTEIDRKEYVWDEASRVTSAKEGGYWSYYEYDAIDQLIEEEKPGLSYLATYTYDANGNRATRTVNSVTETYSYDEADKLEDITVNSNVVKEFTYDAAGRTTAVETGAGVTSLSYDYEGRVTGITYPNTSSDGFGYNGLGSRTSTSGTNGSRTFLRAGLSVTAPVLGDGTADYTPSVSRRESSTTKFSHAGLKNTSTQSAANETVAATKAYDAFGNTVSSSGSWVGPFSYAGNFGYQQDANGLQLLGHRYYDSGIGRFITSDPIGDGQNWYMYVGANPVARADPTGHVVWFVYAAWILAGTIIAGGVAEAPTGNETAADIQRHRYEAAAFNLELASFFMPVPPVVAIANGGRKVVAVTRTITQLEKNIAKGKEAESIVEMIVRQTGNNVDTQVNFKTGLGLRRMDIVETDSTGKIIRMIEVKAGKARYGGAQAAKDKLLEKIVKIPVEVWRVD